MSKPQQMTEDQQEILADFRELMVNFDNLDRNTWAEKVEIFVLGLVAQARKQERERIISLLPDAIEATLDSLNGCGVGPASHSYRLVQKWLNDIPFYLEVQIDKESLQSGEEEGV